MPDFWEFPTVSMGLGADHEPFTRRASSATSRTGASRVPTAAAAALFSATARRTNPRRWAIALAAREELDNLIFVVNCNLQRLDGPVRGNGKIMQELEADFRGCGWNVIKVHMGKRLGRAVGTGQQWSLVQRMNEVLTARRRSSDRGRRVHAREPFRQGPGTAEAGRPT